MKNKRKHTEQADKAEELAKRKLAKLTKVINHAIHNCLVECPKKTLFLNFASAVESLVSRAPPKNFSIIDSVTTL